MFLGESLPKPTVVEHFFAQSWQTVCTSSVPAHACRPNRSEFSVVFFRNSHKYGLGSLRKTLKEGTLPTGPGSTSEQLSSALQPTNQPTDDQVMRQMNGSPFYLLDSIYVSHFAYICVLLVYRNLLTISIQSNRIIFIMLSHQLHHVRFLTL